MTSFPAFPKEGGIFYFRFFTCFLRSEHATIGKIERGRQYEEATQRASDGEAVVMVFSHDLWDAARSFLPAASGSEDPELWGGRAL